MGSGFILTIDIGTTNVKCILFDEEGNEIVRNVRLNTTRYPQPFFAEQDPWQWVESVASILKSMNEVCPEKLRSVKAVSLTGQMHGPVLLELKTSKVLYPCIIWSDARASEEVEMLRKVFPPELFLEKMGNPLQQSFTLPKILWLRFHVPEIFERDFKVLFPKDYIAYLLGGAVATDYSDASGSLIFNLWKRDWEREILRELGLASTMLPDVVPSDSIVGYVSEEAAKFFSLPSGIPIIKGGGDLATTALATGAGAQGNLSLCVGTAGQLLVCAEEVEKEVLGKLYVFLHCVQDKYFYLGTVPTGGASLEWFLSLFVPDGNQSLWEKVGEIEDIPLRRALLFYPFLLGTGTPYFDYRAKAAFLGLQMNHKIEDIVVAILEGVAFALRESLEKVPTVSERVKRIILSGGLARYPLFPRITSYIFYRPVVPSKYVDTASVGAFLLAAKALGILQDYRTESLITAEMEIKPLEDIYTQYYAKLYSLYRSFLSTMLSFASESHRLFQS